MRAPRKAERDFYQRCLAAAYVLAGESPDPSTQNGAIIVGDGRIIGAACNQFAKGLKATPERLDDRTLKLACITHAEEGAIASVTPADRYWLPEATMVCPWAPCPACARDILNAGIARLVVDQKALDRTPERWKSDVIVGLGMLAEAKVELVRLSFQRPLDWPEPITIRFNGERIEV